MFSTYMNNLGFKFVHTIVRDFLSSEKEKESSLGLLVVLYFYFNLKGQSS